MVEVPASKRFIWLTIDEKAPETAGPSLPGPKCKVTATIIATKAKTAAYSFKAWPSPLRKLKNLRNQKYFFFIQQYLVKKLGVINSKVLKINGYKETML